MYMYVHCDNLTCDTHRHHTPLLFYNKLGFVIIIIIIIIMRVLLLSLVRILIVLQLRPAELLLARANSVQIQKTLPPITTHVVHPQLKATTGPVQTCTAIQQQNDAAKSTMSKAIFNLVKGIVGAGVLSLPAGQSVHYTVGYVVNHYLLVSI